MKKVLALLVFLAMCGAAHAQDAISVANEGSTGTTVGKLAKLTGAPSTAIITGTSDTDGIIGVVVAQDATSTTGNAKIAVLGIVNCTFDASGVTAGHYVINSTVTAGDCADGGSSRPTSSKVIGQATQTVASGTGAVNLSLGFTNSSGSGSPANPTATITTTPVNGTASTFMRSDAAPQASAATNATLGIMKGDTSTINCVAGTCTAVGGAATSITPGTTTITGATAPCLIENSTSTTMACPGVGTGVITALGNNLSANGGVTTTIASGNNLALGTSAISSGTCATVVTATATNGLATDVLMASFDGDPTGNTGYIPSTSGMLTIISYMTANTANFKVCNNTSSSITPAATSLNWRVVR